MKPTALRIERLLAKVEAECSARPRRYCFYYDEVAEAEAQGFPYGLVPGELSGEKGEKKYCAAGAGERKKKWPPMGSWLNGTPADRAGPDHSLPGARRRAG